VSEIVAYTDGGWRRTAGIGAWAFVLIERASGRSLERAEAVAQTTSNRMELRAVIEALSALRRAEARVLVLSDSKYTIDCGSRWIPSWKHSGWKRKDGELKNVDLLQELDRKMLRHRISWQWVPGHAGEPGNEHVDRLVNEAMDRLGARDTARWERRFAWTERLP
jgi:ribonuclease HI